MSVQQGVYFVSFAHSIYCSIYMYNWISQERHLCPKMIPLFNHLYYFYLYLMLLVTYFHLHYKKWHIYICLFLITLYKKTMIHDRTPTFFLPSWQRTSTFFLPSWHRTFFSKSNSHRVATVMQAIIFFLHRSYVAIIFYRSLKSKHIFLQDITSVTSNPHPSPYYITNK